MDNDDDRTFFTIVVVAFQAYLDTQVFQDFQEFLVTADRVYRAIQDTLVQVYLDTLDSVEFQDTLVQVFRVIADILALVLVDLVDLVEFQVIAVQQVLQHTLVQE